MWTLLRAAAQHNGFLRTPHSDVRTNGAAADAGASPRSETEVRIYMHPGRMAVAEVDLARAGEQFDLGRAQRFGSLDEAEPACAGRVGFLLELCDSAAETGRARGGAVLFVEGLRS